MSVAHEPGSKRRVTKKVQPNTAYFCLGSNINPKDNIDLAVRHFRQEFNEVITSNLYSSKAVGFEGDDFLNLAVSVRTDRSLAEVLCYADALEQEAGRVRVRRGHFDSRTLDVDLLMYGNLNGYHEGRVWPSEDILHNAYILLPMSEIAGDVEHPVNGVKFTQLWREFSQKDQTLRRVPLP